MKLANWVSALLLLSSYLANYVNPAKFWLFSFIALTYPLLLGINVFFVLYWLLKRKKLILISLASLLIGFGNIKEVVNVQFQKRTEDELKANQLKVLTYNVRLFDLYSWSNKKHTGDSLLKFLNESGADILCLQEYFEQNSPQLNKDEVHKALNNYPHWHKQLLYKSARGNYGIAIFSKYPLKNRGIIDFGVSSNCAIYSDVILKQDTIALVNAHLQSFKFDKRAYQFFDSLKFSVSEKQLAEMKNISTQLRKSYKERVHQSKLICSFVRQEKKKMVVCGDFNTPSLSYSYHLFEQLEMKDAFVEAGSGLGGTYNGKMPSYRIDYILCNPDIDVLNYQKEKVNYSDHYPIWAELSWS